MFFAMLSLFITAIGVVFTASLQYPGSNDTLANATYPLSYGFSRMFNISEGQANWLSFPALIASFYGFVWSYGRQLSSMAKSGLLPDMIGNMSETTDTPYVALLVGMTLSFALALICYYDVFYVSFANDIKALYMLSSYIIYVFMFMSYIVFKSKYSSLTRSFDSPLGIYGAYVGLAVFVVDAFAVMVYYQNSLYALYVLAVATLLMAIYYFTFLHGNQQFSEEEKEKLFKAYLINGKLHILLFLFTVNCIILIFCILLTLFSKCAN